jgi:lipopolysaccharide heptosyltransferase II
MPRAAIPALEPDPRWRAARNVLAVRLDNLGDVIMTTPALAAIRCCLPQARITLLASASGAALAPHLPMVDETIRLDAPWMKSAQSAEAAQDAGIHEMQWIEQLRIRRFDAAIIFTVCTQSALPAALWCRLAGIPLRLAHSRENPYGLLSDWVKDTETVADGMRHEVERQLALIAAVGLRPSDDHLVFQLDAAHFEQCRRRMALAGLDPARRYFIVHPGATAASRRYPAERFGVAADAIARQSGHIPIYTGSADEQALIAAARQHMSERSFSLGGQLELAEFAALIAGARLLVSNNTGPVHVAAALGTPVVDLYALTNPQHTPWKVASRVLSHDVPCRNCLKSECPEGHHGCLRGVPSEAVAAAALELLGAELHDGSTPAGDVPGGGRLPGSSLTGCGMTGRGMTGRGMTGKCGRMHAPDPVEAAQGHTDCRLSSVHTELRQGVQHECSTVCSCSSLAFACPDGELLDAAL